MGDAAGAPGEPILSLPCASLWGAVHAPAPVERFLADLAAEAAAARAAGAGALEFPLDVATFDSDYAAAGTWRRAAPILRSEGLAATVHLPSVWADLASLDLDVWEGSVRSLEAALRAVEPLQPRLAAVHPANFTTAALLGHTPPEGRMRLLPRLGERVAQALARLARGPCGGAVAVENLEQAPLDLVLPVAGMADVGVCLDVGHVVSAGGDAKAALLAATRRLRGVHLHDARRPEPGASVGRAHLPLGAGDLDVEGFAAQLLARGFDGPVVLEVDAAAERPASADRWRRAVGRPKAGGGGRHV